MNSVRKDSDWLAAEYYLGHVDLEPRDVIFHVVPRDALRDALHFAHRRYPPVRVPLAEVLSAEQRGELPSSPARFLFMTDWCGSTLLARAIEQLGRLTLYNEPYAFISLASALRRGSLERHQDWRSALHVSVALMSRGYPGERGGLVKEQPASNLLLAEILAAAPDARAIFLYDTLSNYLCALLKDPWRREYTRDRVASYVELNESALFAEAMRTLPALSDAEVGAVHWLHQLELVERVRSGPHAARLWLLPARKLFQELHGAISGAARALAIEHEPSELEPLLASALFTTYSKSPAKPFDLAARELALRESREKYALEIGAGLRFAEALSARAPWLCAFSDAL